MKAFCTTLLCFFSLLSFGQLKKGALLLEGSVYLSKSSREIERQDIKTSTSSLGLLPKLGIMLDNRWMIGSGLSYHYNHNSQTEYGTPLNIVYKDRMHKFSIEPFVRRYFSISDKLYVNVDLVTSIGRSKTKGESFWNDSESLAGSLSFRAGLSYFINERWGLTTTFGSLYYNITETTTENEGRYTTSDFGLSLQANTFSFGFQYYLRNKTESE